MLDTFDLLAIFSSKPNHGKEETKNRQARTPYRYDVYNQSILSDLVVSGDSLRTVKNNRVDNEW